ncbi:MAG: hypothetical protein AAF636_21930 [Pseudomonadota bacterium]
MIERYDDDSSDANADPFVGMVLSEYDSIPAINTLDEYTHLHEQLKLMRARSVEFYPARFAMELAVLSRLHDYTRKLGLPDCLMPLGDGQGGLVERSPVPEEWVGGPWGARSGP